MEEMRLPDWLGGPREDTGPVRRLKPTGFLEKNIAGFSGAMLKALATEEYASRDGVLQGLEPRAKLLGFFLLIAASAIAGSGLFLSGVLLFVSAMSIKTRVGLSPLAKRVLPAFVFTFAVSLPVALSAVTPGRELVGAFGVAVTAEGLRLAGFFILRVSTMLTLAALLALTTRLSDFFRGLGSMIPGFFVTALFFTFRYVFILIKSAQDATLARKSRTIRRAVLRESQRWFASRAALILKRSFSMAEEVNMAMISRGFSGRIVSAYGAAPFAGRDYLWIGFTSFVLFLSLGI